MRKQFIFLLVFVFIISFTAAPKNVNAFVETPVSAPEVWEWYAEGVTGEVIPMHTITTTPRNWYQLRTDALKVDGATKICHGFDDGRYGWTGEIFRLVDGAWVKLPTTVGWVPTEEGHYMACASAPAAGTYALFGYFDKSKAPVVESVEPALPECYSIGISPDRLSMPWNFDNYPPDVIFGPFYGTFPSFPNAKITYAVINADPALTGDLTGITFTDAAGVFTFAPSEWYYVGPEVIAGVLTIHLVLPTCYYDWTLHWGSTT